MDFVKKHYEKVLLSLVLAGLVGALVFLPFVIAADKQKLDDIANGIINPKANQLPDLDLTRQANVTVRVQAPVSYNFNPPNKLFNPLDWQKMPDGTLKIKNDRNSGPGAAVVTKITPLYFTLTLDAVTTNELGVARYTIGIERQAAATRALQQKTRDFVSVDDKTKRFFTLDHVVGDPVDPDQLVFKLKDTGETATVQKDKPFRRTDGYAADLKYDPDKYVSRSPLRVGATLSFGGDSYTIVDIKPDEVVLLAQSNQKKTSLRYAP